MCDGSIGQGWSFNAALSQGEANKLDYSYKLFSFPIVNSHSFPSSFFLLFGNFFLCFFLSSSPLYLSSKLFLSVNFCANTNPLFFVGDITCPRMPISQETQAKKGIQVKLCRAKNKIRAQKEVIRIQEEKATKLARKCVLRRKRSAFGRRKL